VRVALGGVLLAALALRLAEIGHGLPYVFNADEELHFVAIAARMIEDSTLNPGYFENPPGLTYVFYLLFRAGIGWDGARAFAHDPESAFLVARVLVAFIGTLVAGLAYWAGTRFVDRRAGIVAASLLAFTFLPVFYSKHALNDVVTLAPLTVGLVACLWVYERGTPAAWLVAGAAIGAATATKYTAGAMLATLGVAALARVLEKRSAPLREILGLAAAGAAFGAVFVFMNPFALVDLSEFKSQVGGQSAQAGGTKLGQEDVPGWIYYLWTFTWGFGVLPALAAVAGAVLLVRRDRARALLLIVFPVLLFLFLGGQGRFFGRWMLPAYPALAVLAGYAVVRAVDALRTSPSRRAWALAGATALLVAQGVAASVRVGETLSHDDTRVIARAWLVEHVPRGAKIVVEPFIPDGFLNAGGLDGPPAWDRFPVKRPFQAYEKKLNPALVDTYRRGGYCFVVTGSHQKERGLEAGLQGARAYYERLDRESAGKVVISPYRADADPVGFNFDSSFNYRPRAFARPGPLVEIHRLGDCR